MNKRPVFALLSLLFVASVSAIPINEPTLEGVTENSEEIADFSYDGVFNNDIENKNENLVLSSQIPKTTNTGLCYQNCPKDTVSNCRMITKSVFKYMTKGERNYCLSICPLFNRNCQ